MKAMNMGINEIRSENNSMGMLNC